MGIGHWEARVYLCLSTIHVNVWNLYYRFTVNNAKKALKHMYQLRGMTLRYDGMTNTMVVRMRLGHGRTVDLYVRVN